MLIASGGSSQGGYFSISKLLTSGLSWVSLAKDNALYKVDGSLGIFFLFRILAASFWMGEEKDPQILGISRDVKVSLRSSIVGKPPSVIRFLIGVVSKALKDDLTAA